MSSDVARPGLSQEDRGRVEKIQHLTQAGAGSIAALIVLLNDPSWAVRRVVVTALARIGTPAVWPLCQVLVGDRASEACLAATVDALVASSGDVDDAVLELAAQTMAPAVICDAAQILGRRKSTRSIAALAHLTEHPDDNVAVAAIEALGRIGSPGGLDALVAAVLTRNFFRAFPAIDVLGNTCDPRAVGPLCDLLTDPLYAAPAAAALGRTGQLSAVGPLTDLLIASDGALVGPAAMALTALMDRYEANFDEAAPVRRAFRERLSAPVAASRMSEALERAAPNEKVALCRVLGWVQDPSVAAKLVALLHDDPAVAHEASKALHTLGLVAEDALLAALRNADSATRLLLISLIPSKRSSVQELSDCLADDDGTVRARAAEALGRIGDPAAAPALFSLIGDSDARVSQAAVAAIQSLGSTETKRRALEAAQSEDARTRRAALRIISYFGYPEGLGVLVAATDDADQRIRDVATQGLAFIDDPEALSALLTLTSHTTAHTRASAMRALGQTSLAPRVVAALEHGLADVDAWVRYYSCQALGKLGACGSAEAVVALVRDPAGQVRVAAVESIARLGGAHAVAALDSASQSDDPDVRRAAVLGIGSTRRADALPVLLRELAADDSATRLVALSALAELDAPEAFSALVSAISDVEPSVRSAAFTLLEGHGSPRLTPWLIDQLTVEPLRAWAVRSLSAPREGRVEHLVAALEVASSTLAPHLVAALTRMNRAQGRAAVVSLLESENVFARRAAASALAATATKEARSALAHGAETDSDEEVRQMCLAALRG